MAATAKSSLSGLARALAQHGRLTEAEAGTLTHEGDQSGNGFVAQLVASGKMTARDAAVFASETFGYPLLDLAQFDADQFAADAIDKKLMRTHRVLALRKRGNRIAVAIADPSNLRAIDEVRFQTGLAVDPVVVETDKLFALVDKLSESVERTLEAMSSAEFDFEGDMTPDEDAASNDTGALEIDDAPVVRFIQKLLIDAINEGASDIHFEPYEKYYRIRYRTDGILREIAQPPLVLKEKIAARIKVISLGHFRETGAAGRPDEASCCRRQGHRLPGQHAADPLRREDRHAYSRPQFGHARHRRPGLRARRSVPR
jgi:type IV pilus assembly protein PilB